MRDDREHGSKPGYVYFLTHGGLTKIGFSVYPYGRLEEFSPSKYPGIVLAHVIQTNVMRALERLIHWHFREYHVVDADHEGEEWFALPDAMMAQIRLVKSYRIKPQVLAQIRQGQKPKLPWKQARMRLYWTYRQPRQPPQEG